MPPKVQPKTYILSLKTHKLTAFLTASSTDTIDTIKAEALTALQSNVLDAPNPHAEFGMDVEEDPSWTLPKIATLDDFELCRSIKEKGRPTGKYEVLEGDAVTRNALVNWEAVFVQFRDSNGELQPVKVSLPSVFDEEDEEELSAIRKGKRKAPLESI
ncbi:hypothetical protein AcW2_006263 [Taiwanofungus camphoratus]|nr:hypothetical protein AcW2_006263 [Antrodia cinnamomea]